MNLCSEKHGEICHDGFRCPACDTIEDLQGTIEDLAKELTDVQEQLEKADSAGERGSEPQ